MKKVTVWSLVIVLALLLYLVWTLLFPTVFQQVSEKPPPTDTPIPAPTFTPSATATAVVIVVVTPATLTPSPTTMPTSTFTPEPTPTDVPTSTPTSTPTKAPPQVVSSVAVNIRSGPGTNYPAIGTLLPNTSLRVAGQNDESTWWQIQQTDGTIGWVAASVVEAINVAGISVVQAPPPPPPTATPVPPTPTRPKFQFEPTGWYDDTNYGLTRFLGNITDVNGNPVNGVTVEAVCGTYRVISNPSGPVGGFDSHDSAGDPPGFYDITVAKRPIPCNWRLTVVYTEDGKNTLALLSETVEIEVTPDKSIVTANWRKNW
jgi:hypothetical protein